MKITEAVLVMPLTVLITISLIGLMMTFYNDLLEQIDVNHAMREKIYEVRECTYIRNMDRIREVAGK